MVHDSNFNSKYKTMSNSSIKIVEPPEGVVGEGFFATTLNDVVGIVPIHFAIALCNLLLRY
jgi:NADH-quinone oxidoreductase subunit B